MASKTPLAYLRDQLGFKLAEWQQLPKQDQEDLKRWAAEEIEYREAHGLPVG